MLTTSFPWASAISTIARPTLPFPPVIAIFIGKYLAAHRHTLPGASHGYNRWHTTVRTKNSQHSRYYLPRRLAHDRVVVHPQTRYLYKPAYKPAYLFDPHHARSLQTFQASRAHRGSG